MDEDLFNRAVIEGGLRKILIRPYVQVHPMILKALDYLYRS